MSLFLDEQFIHNISHRLLRFRKRQNYVWSFRCPVCGDSEKHKNTTHGYIYCWKDALRFKCHRCGAGSSFGYFLKEIDEAAYREYIVARMKERNDPTPKIKATPHAKVYRPLSLAVLDGCPTIASLDRQHPARAYVESRQIPDFFFEELYWADDFWSIANRVDPDRFSPRTQGRIIIPFLDVKKQLIAVQGRSLEAAENKYVTIKAFDDAPRIYGMHRLQIPWERLYAVEGPFDSLFLPNCVALAGGDIPAKFPKAKTVIIYDNEPRKKETCSKIAQAIDRGYRVCLWPEDVGHKDINEMILNGYSPAMIQGIIDRHTVEGLTAKLRLQRWRKD